MIHPLGLDLYDDNLPLLQATAVMPLAGGAETLSVGVRLLYVAALAEAGQCVLGFQFLNLRPKARRIVDTYFAEQLRHFYVDSDERAA